MSRAPSRLCLAILLLSSLSGGCGKIREVSACRSVAQDVNQAMSEIEKLSQQKPLDELGIAQRYGALGRALEARGQGVTPLASAVHEYRAVVLATEAALKARAENAKANDSTRELEKLVKRERTAVARIDAQCSR